MVSPNSFADFAEKNKTRGERSQSRVLNGEIAGFRRGMIRIERGSERNYHSFFLWQKVSGVFVRFADICVICGLFFFFPANPAFFFRLLNDLLRDLSRNRIVMRKLHVETSTGGGD